MLNPSLYYYRPPASRRTESHHFDICVYGGTAAGLVAAITAAQAGRSVAVVANGRHLGGLTTGGLGATDFGNKEAVGGLARQFYRRLGAHYGSEERWYFEPSAARKVFQEWLAENEVEIFAEAWLREVQMEGGRIVSLACEDGLRITAAMFIDATYEGDLLAAAGISHTVGREPSSRYDELFNGAWFGHPNHNFHVAIDPYVLPGDPESGLLPEISASGPACQGAGDRLVQAYNFRLCLTSRPDNRIPFSKPPGYRPERYELLRRYITAGIFDCLDLSVPLPNGKTDTNNHGAFSTDYIGGSHRWPQAGHAEREAIFQDHVHYTAGLLYFLQNECSLPRWVREKTRLLGLAADEFPETGGWPPQLYVREGRRMLADYVITEHDCLGARLAPDPVGLGAYGMDSHNCSRLVRHGRVINEGNVEIKGFPPYPVSYRSVIPRRGECGNLLVPVCVSASHIAFGSLRMETVFMVLGESCAEAACLALATGAVVQDVPYPVLRDRLLARGQRLAWPVCEEPVAAV